ncbi:MAG: WD40 repeat domain-containing protein, partial [Gammaproteobacteria bacterium]
MLLNAESSSAQALGDFISQQITNQVSRSTSNAISKNLSDNLIIPQLKIRNESGEVKDFSISSDGRLFSLLHEDGTIRVWDSKQGIQRPTLSPGGKTFTHVLSVSSADTTLAGHSDGSIEIFDVVTGKSLSLLPSHNA